jgi:membrane protein DedA with SNARE-associated domain
VPVIVFILVALLVTLIENIFPPAPSDVIFVAISILVGVRTDNELTLFAFFLLMFVILAAGVGGTLGFWIMYLLGNKFGHSIIEQNRMKFISTESVLKVERMFQKWGFKLVAINRFMSGTRAVISFVAGMSHLNKSRTLTLAGVSSIVYYALLGIAGFSAGNEWQKLAEYIVVYQTVVFWIVIGVVVLAGGFALVKWILSVRKKKGSEV